MCYVMEWGKFCWQMWVWWSEVSMMWLVKWLISCDICEWLVDMVSIIINYIY
jgi:hypothetical protein